jgi:adenylate cyclase
MAWFNRAFMRTKWLILAAACAIALLALPFPSGPFGLEWKLQDAFQRWMPAPLSTPDLLIVAVNERSVELLERDLGRWPWPREAMARILDFMGTSGVRRVGVDILFPNPDEGDEAMKEALARVDHILVADLADREPSGPPGCEVGLPLPAGGERLKDFRDTALPCSLLLPGTRVASIHLLTDDDGVARRYRLHQRSGARLFLSLAALLADVPVALEPEEIPLRFYGPGGTFDYLDAWKVLWAFQALESEGETAEVRAVMDRLKGKTVLFGVTATSGFDRVVSPTTEIFPGIELHATAYANLMDRKAGRAFGPVPTPLHAAAGPAFLLLLFLLLFKHRPPLVMIGVFLVLAAALFGGAAYLFHRNVQAPSTWLLLASFGLFFGLFSQDFLAALREKRRISATFSRYVSPKVFRHLLDRGSLPELGGELRQITVLFSDIRSFTTLSEATPPDRLVAWLNEYFTLMVSILYKHDGTLDKFIGDAVMAYWGAPMPEEKHAERAVRCAMEMAREVAKWNEGRISLGLPPLYNGIGINSGPAIVGSVGADIGVEKSFNFTCLGDTVNAASRVEGLTKQFKKTVLFTGSTARLLPPDILVECLGDVEVKGKMESVTIYALKEDA